MRSQRFGIEMEMTGISRKKAAEVIAAYFGARAVYDGGSYDAYHVTDGQGRNWKVVSDASIHPAMRDGRSASNFYKVEVVSPIGSSKRYRRALRAMTSEICNLSIIPFDISSGVLLSPIAKAASSSRHFSASKSAKKIS